MADTLDVLLFKDSQSGPDANRQPPSPTESHKSLLEAISNDIESSISFRSLEPQLCKTYRDLPSFLGRSTEQLLKLVSCPCHDFLSPSTPNDP